MVIRRQCSTFGTSTFKELVKVGVRVSSSMPSNIIVGEGRFTCDWKLRLDSSLLPRNR